LQYVPWEWVFLVGLVEEFCRGNFGFLVFFNSVEGQILRFEYDLMLKFDALIPLLR